MNCNNYIIHDTKNIYIHNQHIIAVSLNYSEKHKYFISVLD